MQAFTAEKRKEKDEEEDEAKNISFESHGAKNMDLEVGDVDEEEEKKKKHICLDCGKDFKSGKALGGHKRIHRIEFRKSRPKMVFPGIVGRSETGVFDCCVCPKKFTSMKALYGHMRFHPYRGWKGVFPPPPHPLGNGNSSSSTLSIDDDDYEFQSSDYDDDDDDDENSELVENVVELKRWGTKGKRGSSGVLKVDETDPKSKDIDTEKLLFLATVALDLDLYDAETSQTHSDEDKMKKKKKRILSEVDKISYAHVTVAEESDASARENHVCLTCNKSFTSYQALGGHRASHNKVKILENHQVRASNDEASLLGTEEITLSLACGQGSNTFLSSTSNNGVHICNICSRSFPTGQALGGHKRSHWTASATTAAQTSGQASGSSCQVTETVQVQEVKKKFLFDLNELPPDEEEEEEEERV